MPAIQTPINRGPFDQGPWDELERMLFGAEEVSLWRGLAEEIEDLYNDMSGVNSRAMRYNCDLKVQLQARGRCEKRLTELVEWYEERLGFELDPAFLGTSMITADLAEIRAYRAEGVARQTATLRAR